MYYKFIKLLYYNALLKLMLLKVTWSNKIIIEFHSFQVYFYSSWKEWRFCTYVEMNHHHKTGDLLSYCYCINKISSNKIDFYSFFSSQGNKSYATLTEINKAQQKCYMRDDKELSFLRKVVQNTKIWFPFYKYFLFFIFFEIYTHLYVYFQKLNYIKKKCHT